ncbi:MAG: glycerophosphoryl diester phosphodiesterase membrane domain-containing protein [Steroidobacterales bacterium]|jgi:hypothetical protein
MTSTLYPPPRPQTVGEILDTAFRIFSVTLLKCLPLAALSLLAGQLGNIYSLLKGQPLQSLLTTQRDPRWWLLAFVGYVIALTMTSAIVRRQCAIASGQPASPRGELAAALRLVPGLFVVLVLFVLAMAAGLVLFIIPGLYIATRLAFATTAYLLTDRGVFESLSYSWQLTEGHVWRLSLIFTVYIALVIVFYVLAGVIATVIGAPFALGDIALFTAVTAAVTVIVGSIVRPFYTALALAVFGDLTVRTEGTDLAARISSSA